MTKLKTIDQVCEVYFANNSWYIGYLAIVFLLITTTIVGLTGALSIFTYTIAGIHLSLTILTVYRVGLIKVIPFALHGVIEPIVCINLIISPWKNFLEIMASTLKNVIA